MRLDQFLQKTGIVKRRTLAKEICDRGLVEIGGRKAKAAHEVSPKDVLTVKFNDRRSTYAVLAIPLGNVRKEDRVNYAQLTAEERFHEE
jgi:ribosomal 50S subunit-recycling heat shock protein